ncbi:MAG: hypothetical protein Tsb002_37490 [Wenzhouxiangellaceae bacterium]
MTAPLADGGGGGRISPPLSAAAPMFIEFHRNMLGDYVRNDAFYHALRQVIRPGMVVADVGAGTGLLSFMARRLGAAEVYLMDHGPVLDMAEQLAADNGIDGLVFLRDHSTAVFDLPPVDLVISETLGNYVYEEHLIENLNDARRFLKPDGLMIPARASQFIAPVINPRFLNELTLWDQLGFDLNYDRARAMSLNNLYVRSFTPADIYRGEASVQCWDQVDLQAAEPPSSIRQAELQWTCDEDVKLYGFANWWSSALTDQINLGTSPWQDDTHWEQIYFPVLRPLRIPAGGTLTLKLQSDTRYEIGSHLRWQCDIHSADGVCIDSQDLDIDRGDLPD